MANSTEKNDTLKREFQYFLDHQSELVKAHINKYLIIKDEKVIGEYNSIEEAYEYATKRYELGTFLIQHCIPGEQAYKQTFNSRVVFS